MNYVIKRRKGQAVKVDKAIILWRKRMRRLRAKASSIRFKRLFPSSRPSA